MQKDIKQTWFFQQSPEEVWGYLTKPELIEQWLMKTDFKPIKGYKFNFIFSPKANSQYDGFVHCEVLEVEPFYKLSYSWNGSANNQSRIFNSIVTWLLIPKDNGTELQLQHNGFDSVEDILNHSNGWKTCLERFEKHINSFK